MLDVLIIGNVRQGSRGEEWSASSYILLAD